MGNLPSYRLQSYRPFLKVGVDFAGPIVIHLTKGRGQKSYKAYICLFICLSTKAIHIELVSDLSSDAFLAALKRFIARRGCCAEIFSDNGTNFVGANNQLQKSFKTCLKTSNELAHFISRNTITCHFIPPHSPNFGGIWESAIKSAKFHLKRVIGESILTMEEIMTLLAEIESILNSRPLCVLSADDVDALTPSHFLIGQPATKLPEQDITHLKPSHLSRWEMIQHMSQHFWKRWKFEYLTTLQQRSKWTKQQERVNLNDIVIIKEDNTPVNKWTLGKIIKLHPGSDDIIRVVTLKTKSGELKRPVNKLVKLPIEPAGSKAAEYCLHLQLYRDSKDRYKHGQTKASLSLQHFLGVESGFTLDKESNTIAIICQDVIVVLAFDTRERLIQWQVKISNNLGDDLQYLVLVSSSPPKAKLSTGPTRMHIQDHRFCLTTGVPPRLVGLWGIGHLRRYGVVDGRFCFEGGSSCGKGEGLYVFVTDQSDEITHTLKLASQGRLVTKRRPTARKVSALDSPRKQLTSQVPEIVHEHSCVNHITNSNDHMCTCQINNSSYWPSQESRELDSNYGCGDTLSVTERNDSFNDSDLNSSRNTANIERCMSCISKLGAPSMSRSSTTTGTPSNPPSQCWPHSNEHINHHQHHQKNFNNQNPISDSMSLGSHCSSNSSEYSVPRSTCKSAQPNAESWYEKAPTFLVDEITRTSSPCQCCQQQPQQPVLSPPPNRPPKPKPIPKPPMPLPTITQPTSNCMGPYENYDVPKTPYLIESSENYDTPKKIKDLLDGEKCNSPDTVYGNYDTPLSIGQTMCGCSLPTNENINSNVNEIQLVDRNMHIIMPKVDCTCHRVMSWADNWIPICRRGNGVENTGVPINRIKLSGEGKMPVMKPSGELAIYATVDMAKKISRRVMENEESAQNTTCDCSNDCNNKNNNRVEVEANCANNDKGNYTNIDISSPEAQQQCSLNYINLEFEKSLVTYENAKEIKSQKQNDKTESKENEAKTNNNEDENNSVIKVCHRCRFHATSNDLTCENLTEDDTEKLENYMMMEPGKIHGNVSGYIPMSPANSNLAPPLPSKTELLKRILSDKTASSPTLCGPAVDRSRKRCKNERITGTAMMMLCRNAGSPYNRKQLMDSTDLLPIDKRLVTRKRSSSAESSNLVETTTATEEPECELKSRKSSFSQIEGRRSSSPCLHQETELCEDESCCTKISVVSSEAEDMSTTGSQTNSQISQQNYIRRSASVPCKGQNRDSSSSNDSGVSTGSLRHRGGDFNDIELPLSGTMIKKYQRHIPLTLTCVHSSLPRRSKSFDPLREITFQFQKIKIPEKSTSAEAEVPVCPPKQKGYGSPIDGNTVGPPYIDSRSTSSGTSDMSDYIETLSLSSHSSCDTPDSLKLIRHQPTSTLRPRSGKEYHNIDRSLISLTQTTDGNNCKQLQRGLLPCSANYANITPVPENAESPSPGYQSGSSPQESIQNDQFMFKNETTKS